MPDVDLFNFFRWGLFIFGSVYVTVVMLQQGYQWYVWLATNDRYIGMVRRYIIVHGLRLRFRTFWGDVLICLLLCIVFVLLAVAHGILRDIGRVSS